MGIFLAAAAPRHRHRGLASTDAYASARHRLWPWRSFPHVVRERRLRRRRDGHPRGTGLLRAGEEGCTESDGRGARPDRPRRCRVLAVSGRVVRRHRGNGSPGAPRRTGAHAIRGRPRPATRRTILHDAAVSRLAASMAQETLHPDLLHEHVSAAGSEGHPDRHRREGFTTREIAGLGSRAGLRMDVAYTYRIPLPDRVMKITPRAFSRSVAQLGTRPLPLGLQLYAEFTKT